MNPLVSCCLLTYNHSGYINQAIESVLMQETDFEFEIIISDDCSTDGTKEKIKHFASKFPGKIKPIFREKNTGGKQNFVELLQSATGKYIAILDGDDYWTDSLKLQQQVDFLEANNMYAISSHNTIVKHKNKKQHPYSAIVQQKLMQNTYGLVDYLQNHFIHISSVIFRREMLKPLPAWFLNTFAGDGFLILLLAMEGNIHYINKPMSVYRHNDNSISNFNSQVEISKNFEEHYKNFDKHSHHTFSKQINEKIFSLSFNLNYYNTNYVKKLIFFTRNLYTIIKINKKVLPLPLRFKFLLPSQILKSRININQKNRNKH